MGADVGEASGHGPSEFSIVHDSIRRDREALFEGTRRVRARSLSTRALRLSVFRYSPEIGQPERPTHARLSDLPSVPAPHRSPRRSSYRV